METIRVKVKQATSNTWYEGLNTVIGKEFEVSPNYALDMYEVNDGQTKGNFLFNDCEVVSVTMVDQKTILQEAQAAVYGDRQADYGTVTENFNTIAKLWSAILKIEVTPQQVGLCMIQVKVAREMYKPKRDNLVDIAGYAATLEKLSKGE